MAYQLLLLVFVRKFSMLAMISTSYRTVEDSVFMF